MLVHLLEIDFKQQLGCRFDIMDSFILFCILTYYAIIYVLIHHIIFWLYLYFLNILYFSGTPILTSSIDVFYRYSPHENKIQYIVTELYHPWVSVYRYPIKHAHLSWFAFDAWHSVRNTSERHDCKIAEVLSHAVHVWVFNELITN